MFRKPVRCILLAIVLLATAGCTGESKQSSTPADERSKAIVDRVVDGDTIRVKFGSKTERVRLIGVDTPETVAPNKPVGCYGKEASEFTKSLLPKGTAVRVVLDVEPRDRYDRLLGYVYRSPDGLFVNAELARQGYANILTIPPNVAHVDEFLTLTREAREENRGLWRSCVT